MERQTSRREVQVRTAFAAQLCCTIDACVLRLSIIQTVSCETGVFPFLTSVVTALVLRGRFSTTPRPIRSPDFAVDVVPDKRNMAVSKHHVYASTMETRRRNTCHF